MELKQLRYFIRVVEFGSMSRAAADLEMVPSALSQQISHLESELSTRLLQRTSKGVHPTEAGLAFFREAQLSLRHAEQAAHAAQRSRLSGTVSVGLAPSTSAVLGLPLILAMRSRYPDVRLHMIEGLASTLAQMLNARQLDLAVLFDAIPGRLWSVTPLLDERLYLVQAYRDAAKAPSRVTVAQLAGVPLIQGGSTNGLGKAVRRVFASENIEPTIIADIDSAWMLLDAVEAGIGASVQPWAMFARLGDISKRFHVAEITNPNAKRRNTLCSVSDAELTPAALAARLVLTEVVRDLIRSGRWQGVVPIDHKS